jgi:hypothetical protein
MAGALVVALLIALAVTQFVRSPSSSPGAAPGVDGPASQSPSAAISAPAAARGQETAYVTASVLSCREAPARQAKRVINIARGTQVEILARDGDWLSIALDVGQCWTLARYVSEKPPI